MPEYQGPSALNKQFKVYTGKGPLFNQTVTDLTDYIVWEESNLAMRAAFAEGTTSTIVVRDETGKFPFDYSGRSFINAHNVCVLTVGSNTIWRGRVVGVNLARGAQPAERAKEIEVNLEDYNADLDGIVIHNWARTAETDVARVQGLVASYLSGSPRNTTNLNGSNYVSSSNTTGLDAETFYEPSPRDVLTAIASYTDKEIFVTVDGELFYDGHDSTAYQSLLRISDKPANQNAVTYAPRQPEADRFMREQLTRIRYYYGNDQATDTGFVTNDEMGEWDYWEEVYNDDRSTSDYWAAIRARKYLNFRAGTEFGYTCRIGPMSGDEVWKIKAGQTINIQSRATGKGREPAGTFYGDNFQTRRIREVRWHFPGVDMYEAELEIDKIQRLSPPVASKTTMQAANSADDDDGLVCVPVRTNRLLGLTGTSLKVSSEHGPRPAEMAVNGDDTTADHWSAAATDGVIGNWIAADMGETYSLLLYRVKQGYSQTGPAEPEGASQIYQYGSNDAADWAALTDLTQASFVPADWTPISIISASTTGSDTGVVRLTEAASFRYVVLYASAGPSAGTGDGWNVQEWELYTQVCELDHGTLSGTGDDDHPQYVLKSLLTTAGDIPYATGASTWTRLPIGGSNTHLTSSGTTPVWMPNTGGGSLTDHDHTAAGDGGDLSAALVSNYLNYTDQTSAPSSPAAGKTLMYSSNSQFYLKTSGGTVARVVSADIANAKGDIFVATADNAVTRLAAGANGRFLQADSTVAEGLKWSSAASSSVTIGGSLGDIPPDTPGTYDEEFVGTADTLPTNWAWDTAPSGSDAWYLNSRWPGLLFVQGNGNATYNLKRTSFSPGASTAFGVWCKAYLGSRRAADSSRIRMYVSDSGETNVRGIEPRVATINQVTVRSLKKTGAAESQWGANSIQTYGNTYFYFGITRDASNNYLSWWSNDGIAWALVATTESASFTVDRVVFLFKTDTEQSTLGLDWFRYRTDTEFPRIA